MYKVLLVDDVALNLLVAKKMLSRLPLEITTASNGQEAVDAIQKEQPDLLLVDLMMPVMDGYEVIRRIRKGELGNQDCPIIVLSALNSDRDIVLALDMGANDYVTKPIIMERLLESVKKILKI